MSQYHNLFAFQSGLRNAEPDQNRQQQRGSAANMPIFLDKDPPSPALPSFQTGQRRPFSNFSSDLRSLAFAAKSSLGLCDGAPTRSDALQSLMSYGTQAVQNELPKPSQGQRNCYELGSPSKSSYTPDPGYLHPSLLSRNTLERSHQEEFYSAGASQRQTFANEPQTPTSVKEDSQGSFASFNPMGMDRNDGSYTPFKPPPQLNTVEDEDEFLYGDSTPVPETPSSRTEDSLTHKQGKETRSNPGLGSWSDEESIFGEEVMAVHPPVHTIVDPPTSKSKEKEATSIPLKNLSWQNKHAWKDEVQVIQDFTKSQSPQIKAFEKPKDKTSPRVPEITVVSPLSDKKSAKYASAALLLKKQLDPNKLSKRNDDSDVPPGAKALVDAPKDSERDGMWVNFEPAGKKRVVSMSAKSQYDRDISPEPRETREPDREMPSRYRDGDKYVKNFYERKASRPQSPSRRSPDRYRSPSPGYRSRGRSRGRSPEYRSRGYSRSPEYRSRGRSRGRSPEYRSRGRSRSRPRHPDEYSREKSRGRSRGRSQPRLPDDRLRQDKDGKSFGKRPHSPDDQLYKGDPSKKKPIPPSVEASLAAETPEEEGLFPKSMSQEMFSMYMKESQLKAGSKKISTESPQSASRFSDPSIVSSGPANQYIDPSAKLIEQYSDLSAKPLKPIEQYSDLSAKASKPVMRFLNPSAEASKPVCLNQYADSVSESPKPINRYPAPLKPVKQLSGPVVALKQDEPTKPVHSKTVVPAADQHIVTQKLNFCLRLVYQTDSLNKCVAFMQEAEEAKKINMLAQKVELAFDANARQIQEQGMSISQEVQQPSVPYLPHTLPQPPQVAPYPSVPMYPQQMPNVPQPMAQPHPYSYLPNVPPVSFPFNPVYPPPPIANQVYPRPIAPQVDTSHVPPSTAKVANRCLRSIPVLSQEEIKKINSKEPQDHLLVEKYNKHVEEHNLCLKKLKSLSEQRVEINKIKTDFINKSKKVRGGGDTQFLSEMEMVEEKVEAAHLQTIDEMKVHSQEVWAMAIALGPQKMEQMKAAPKVSPGKKKPAVVFGCFDSGQHFCVQCGIKFSSILDIVKHLHSQKHLEHEGPTDKVDSKIPPKTEATVTSLQPAKGVEFVKPLSAFYCTLCDETLLNPLFAEQHVKGHEHTMKYMSYLRENPMYEEKHRLLVNARMAAAEKENRLKTLEDVSKARQFIIKKNQEMDEKLKKVQNKLKKDQANPIEELEEAHSGSIDSQKKGAAIKFTLGQKEQQEKPKRQVIYIGRAPNFRPRSIAEDTKTKDKQAKRDEAKRDEKESRTSNQSSHKQSEVKESSCSDRKSSRENSKQDIGPAERKKGSSDEKVKVFGCKSEAESQNRNPEAESKSSSRKYSKTVQLQMEEPKTNNPAVNQALKNIMYGSKSNTQGKVPDLSAIKLPEGPPLPPLPKNDPVQIPPLPKNEKVPLLPLPRNEVKPKTSEDLPTTHKTPEGPQCPPQLIKDTVKSKLRSQRPVSLTEEEKDFILLGIDKSDMQPIATPKPPPNIRDNSSPVKNIPLPPLDRTSIKNVKLPDVTVPPPKMVISPPQGGLPNTSVPPPTLQVALPNLQVPPPNFQVPPPNLQQIPLPNLQVPPPRLTVPPPKLAIPPPNLQLSTSQLNKTNTMQTPGYNVPKFSPAPTKYSTVDTDDMDIDIEEVLDPKIEVGIPISGDTNNQVKVEASKGSSNSKNKSCTVSSDKTICTNILSSVINTVLEKHTEVPSEISNTASTTDSSTTNVRNAMEECLKSAKDISPDPFITNVSEKSSALEESEKLTTTESITKEATENKGNVNSFTTDIIIVETSDATQNVTSFQGTEEISRNDNIEASSAGSSVTENNSISESEMLEKSQSPSEKLITTTENSTKEGIESEDNVNSFTTAIVIANTSDATQSVTSSQGKEEISNNDDIEANSANSSVAENNSTPESEMLEKSLSPSEKLITTTEGSTKEGIESEDNVNSFTTAIVSVNTSDATQSVTSSQGKEEISNNDGIEVNSASLSITENKSTSESEVLEKSQSSTTDNPTSTKEVTKSENNINSYTIAIVETSDVTQKVTNSQSAEEMSNNNNDIEAYSASLSIADSKSIFESEMFEKSQSSAIGNSTTSKNNDEGEIKEVSAQLVSNQETVNLESVNVKTETEVQSLSTTAQYYSNTKGKNNETSPITLEIIKTNQHIMAENFSSVYNIPVVQEENSPSCSELLNTPSNISVKDYTEIMEENSSSCTELLKAPANPSSENDNSNIPEESCSSYTELLNAPSGIPTTDNEQKQNIEDPINVLSYEDICKTPLIHSIEHFMDSNADEELQQDTWNAQESPKNSLAEQESRIELQVKEDISMSITLEKQELHNSPFESMKNTGEVLGFSRIEAMEVEETGIQNVLPQNLDLQMSCPENINTPTVGSESILLKTFGEDTSVPMEFDATEIPNAIPQDLPVSSPVTENISAVDEESNLQKSFEEVPSNPMVVETSKIPIVKQEDLPISFLGTKNTPPDEAEVDLQKTFKEASSIQMKEEIKPQNISATSIADAQILNVENNLLNTCISGPESFDCNSRLDSEIPIQLHDSSMTTKCSAENLEVIKALEESKDSELVLENLETYNHSPMDLEPTSNPKEIEIIEKPNTLEPVLCELNPLTEKCSGFTEQREVEEVSEKEFHMHVENVAKDLPPKLEDLEEQLENLEGSQLNQENSKETIITLSSKNNANEILKSDLSKGCEETKLTPVQDVPATDEPKLEEAPPTALCLSEDSSSRDNEGLGSAVPCLDKFDLDDSLSNSISGDPPVLSEVSVKKEDTTIENILQKKAVREKKNDSETDEYDTEDGPE